VAIVALGVFVTAPTEAYIPEYWWQMSPYQSCTGGLYCMDCCEPWGTCYQSACRPLSDLERSCNPVF
jgi:hypothetical protein